MVKIKNVVVECCECGKQEIVMTEGFTYVQIQPSSIRYFGKCTCSPDKTNHRFLGLKGERNQVEKVIFT